MGTYLIVGASSGIGRQTALQLAQNGHTVYGTYNNTKVDSDNSRIIYNALNVLDEQLVLDFLPDTIDGIVYCPGTISLRPFKRINPADFVADYQLQVIGAIKVIQAALSKFKGGGTSSILLFSTVAVRMGLSFHTQVACSKGAIEGLTRSLASELAPGIRVNCIAPSLTDTPLAAGLINTAQKIEANAERHPLKRIGSSEDIANMAEFLLSDKASWITGQVLHVDGGIGSIK